MADFTLHLTPDEAAFVHRLLSSGRYESVDEVCGQFTSQNSV